MNLKNYTSTVAASKSIGNIDDHLIEYGATDIARKYDENKICKSITFRLMINNLPVFFQISVNINACYKIISKDRVRQNEKGAEIDRKQAERTAWKIVSDWVEIQIAMVMMQQMDLMQAFLSQVYDQKKDQTFYTSLKHSDFKQLPFNQ